MKTNLYLVLLAISLYSNISVAGMGVIVGDGAPINNEPQEYLDQFPAQEEFKEFTRRIYPYFPEISMRFVSLLDSFVTEKFIPINILEDSKTHYSGFEAEENDGEVSNITLFFWKNFYKLPLEDKINYKKQSQIKVILHEFCHLLFSFPELKAQRLTELFYKLSLDIDVEWTREKILKEIRSSSHTIRNISFIHGYRKMFDRVSIDGFRDDWYIIPRFVLNSLKNENARHYTIYSSIREFYDSLGGVRYSNGKGAVSEYVIFKAIPTEGVTYNHIATYAFARHERFISFQNELYDYYYKDNIRDNVKVDFFIKAERTFFWEEYKISFDYFSFILKRDVLKKNFVFNKDNFPELESMERIYSNLKAFYKLYHMTPNPHKKEYKGFFRSFDEDVATSKKINFFEDYIFWDKALSEFTNMSGLECGLVNAVKRLKESDSDVKEFNCETRKQLADQLGIKFESDIRWEKSDDENDEVEGFVILGNKRFPVRYQYVAGDNQKIYFSYKYSFIFGSVE